MLPKIARLHNTKDISRVMRSGRFFRNTCLVVKYIRNTRKHCRFAFIVSNKISKKATVRNLIRRQLRSIIFLYKDRFRENYDMIVIVRAPLLKLTFQEIEKELEKLLIMGKFF